MEKKIRIAAMEKKDVLDKTLSVHVKISTGKLEAMIL